MGTWGIGSFENDDAADFMIDALKSGDLSLVREVLDGAECAHLHPRRQLRASGTVARDRQLP